MKTIKSFVGGMALLASASAFATPVNLGGESPDLQTVINGLYTAAGTPLGQAPNVNDNQAAESGQFKIEASGGSVSTMVIEVAGNHGTNTFGIYDLNDPTRYLQLFSGGQTEGNQAFLSVDEFFNFTLNVVGPTVQFTSASFGYYLGNGGAPIFYSQAFRNGGNDHMVAFQGDGDLIKLPTRPAGEWGNSSYILAWEDVSFSGSDLDYQDMVVYVESVTPVPEPGTTALLGLAGLGLALSRRRKQGKPA